MGAIAVAARPLGRRAGRAVAAVLAVAAAAVPAGGRGPGVTAGGPAVDPYVDPAQLSERPSFLRQPWRGWMDTVAATRFLDGIGIQYRVPGGTDHDDVLATLAAAGVRRVRFEAPWNDVTPSGDRLTDAGRERLDRLLAAAADHGVAVLLVLNANSLEPTPHETTRVTVAERVDAGADELRLESVDGVVPRRSGLTGLVSPVMAGVMVTGVDRATGTVALGSPLPVDLAAGEVVTMDTLAYAPLHAVGTPEFEATARGWEAYVDAVLDVARRHDVPGLGVEIWNETAFGSEFLDIAHYVDDVDREGQDKFRPGGRAWELARRTVDLVHREHPGVRVYWGFSSTNHFAVPVADLPPGIDAISYHVYGTGVLDVPAQFPEPRHLGDYDHVPDALRLAIPEGLAATAAHPNPLIRRRLAPAERDERPASSDGFEQVVTEHGCTPRQARIADPAAAMHYKARCLLRYLPFWLHKGIGELYASRAWDEDPLGRGLLDPTRSPARGGDLGTEATTVLGNLVRTFAGAEEPSTSRRLGVDVNALDPQEPVLRADDGQVLRHADQLAVLPFQVDDTRFALAVYVMTYDLTAPMAPERYRLTVTGVEAGGAEVRWYDPLTDRDEPVVDVVRGDGALTVTVAVSDTTRVLVVDETPPAPPSPTRRWLVPAAVALAGAAAALAAGWLLLLRAARSRS